MRERERERGIFTSIKIVPNSLKFQFEKGYASKHNFSDKCCYHFKKTIFWDYELTSKRVNSFTGMRKEEGGNRENLNCITTSHNGKHFNVLLPVSDDWEDEFIKRYNIKLCELYYPPFNFKRTGCMCCPNSENVQEELLRLKKLAPSTYKQAIRLWKPVYDEYIRIGYRLDKDFYNKPIQYDIFDFLEE